MPETLKISNVLIIIRNQQMRLFSSPFGRLGHCWW